MERRKRDRVQVKLECQVDRPGLTGRESCNVTENISRTGMLIRWARQRSAAPAIGDAVVVKLKRPRNPVFGQRWMLFRADVVRVSHAEDRSLMVAVTGSPVRFSAAA